MLPRAQSKLQLLRLLPAGGPGLASGLVVVLLIDALAPIFTSITTGLVVGAVPRVVATGFSSGPGRHLLVLLGILAVCLVSQRVMSPAREAITNAFGRAVDLRLRERVMSATMAPAGIAHLEDPSTLDLVELSRGVAVWGGSPGRAVAGMAMILSVRLSGLAALVVLARFRWWLSLALAAVAWIVVAAKYRLYLEMSTRVTSSAEGLRRMRYFRSLVLSPEAAKEVRVFGLVPWAIGRYNGAWVGAMAEVWRSRSRRAPRVVLAMVLRAAGAMVTVALVARAAVRGEISLAAAVVYAQAVDTSAVLSFTIGNAEILVEQGMAATAATSRLEARMAAAAIPSGTTSAEGLPRQGIRFEGVRFRYPGRERDVFTDLDLEIPAGHSLAIVGDNGAGKTTIVKLLTRLHDPVEGRISVDGVDLRDLDVRAWHRRVAAIFQDFSRFPLTARENIAWGSVAAPSDPDAVEQAAEAADVLRVIDRLPARWDTPLTRQFEGGVDLSGGQWQRVALARALYAVRGGAGVLVLDEPTAHLDVRSEAHLYNRFLELTGGLTSVIISHRFSTVRRADRIVVVEEGRVIEQGSHDELVAAGGRYAAMFEVQAARFVGSDDAPQ